MTTPKTLHASDGKALALYHWAVPGTPRAVVQLVHGVSDHARRYAPLAAALNAAGFELYALDLRGHGATAESRDQLGRPGPGGWMRWIEDLRELNAHIQRQHARRPRVMIGHSMGSFLAQHFACLHGDELDGLVLCASDYRPDPLPRLGHGIAGLLLKLRGRQHRSWLLDFASTGVLRYGVPHRRTPWDWLNRDPEEVDRYRADPWAGQRPATALWREVYAGLDQIARPEVQARIPKSLPVLLLVGDGDPLSGGGRRVAALAAAYRARGIRDVELRCYPGARHELFLETNRAEVYADLASWLRARLTGSTEGPEA